MADVDIDPFGKHESRPQEPTDEIFLLPQLEEDQFGNWNVNRKHHSEGNLWKLLNMKPWKVSLKVCIKGYLEATMNPQEESIFTISTSEMDSYTTKTMSIP